MSDYSRPVDYYEVLQVSQNASPEIIQAAYRVLIRNCHPDWHPDERPSARVIELNQAYAVLSNTEQRARYDFDRARLRRSTERRFSGDELPSARAGVARQPVTTARAVSRGAALPARAAPLSVHTVLILLVMAGLTALVIALLWLSIDGEPPTSAVNISAACCSRAGQPTLNRA